MKCEASINKTKLVEFLQSRTQELNNEIDLLKSKYQKKLFDGFNRQVDNFNEKRDKNFFMRLFAKKAHPFENPEEFSYENYKYDDFLTDWLELGYGKNHFPEYLLEYLGYINREIKNCKVTLKTAHKVLDLCNQTDQDFVVIDQELWNSIK